MSSIFTLCCSFMVEYDLIYKKFPPPGSIYACVLMADARLTMSLSLVNSHDYPIYQDSLMFLDYRPPVSLFICHTQPEYTDSIIGLHALAVETG